jgi:hypothetical protein
MDQGGCSLIVGTYRQAYRYRPGYCRLPVIMKLQNFNLKVIVILGSKILPLRCPCIPKALSPNIQSSGVHLVTELVGKVARVGRHTRRRKTWAIHVVCGPLAA